MSTTQQPAYRFTDEEGGVWDYGRNLVTDDLWIICVDCGAEREAGTWESLHGLAEAHTKQIHH